MNFSRKETQRRTRPTKTNPKQLIKCQKEYTYIPIITLNINGLNASTRRNRMAEWIKKQDPYIYCLQETQHIQTESESMEKLEAKGKGEKERYTHLNAEFQRIARGEKKAFLCDQCKDIEENDRTGKDQRSL